MYLFMQKLLELSMRFDKSRYKIVRFLGKSIGVLPVLYAEKIGIPHFFKKCYTEEKTKYAGGMGMSKVYIFFADGYEDIEGLTVVDLMRRAGIDIQTVSIKESREITTSHGIEMKTDLIFSETDFSDADMLVIPGGMPGTKYLGEYKPLCDLLTSFYNDGKKIAAICAAPTVFAKLGFLEGRTATAYPTCMDGLAGAIRSEEEVVIDGNVTTSRGLGTAIPFALSLIEQLISKEKSEEIAESVVFKRE